MSPPYGAGAGAAALAELLAHKRRILVFTGAGISTGSGIPDFRGPDGVWKRRQPVTYPEFRADPEKRREYWEYKSEGYEAFRAAMPNPAHRALVRLEPRLAGLVTQNIDGLHQLAGSSERLVLELHGTNRMVECIDCGWRDEPDQAMAAFRATGDVPACGSCGAPLKLATISFGQALRPDVLQRAAQLAERADAVLALGSTLSVHPAASIPLLAADRGVPYAIVNRGETEHDHLCQLRIEADVVEVVPAAVALLES